MSEDAELLKDYVRRGNANALSALIVRHSPWMSALLRGMLPDADVEDVLQDTWLKVIRSAHNFRGDGIKSYLGTVVRSVAIDRLRQCDKTVNLDAEEDDTAQQELIDKAPLPDEKFESAATKEDVLRAVRELPDGPRQVLLLRIEAEMPFREIAEALHVPLGTALTWMRTATLYLKAKLGGNP